MILHALNHIQSCIESRHSETPESLRLFFWKIGIYKLPGNKESGYLSVEVINLQTETIHDMESIKKGHHL